MLERAPIHTTHDPKVAGSNPALVLAPHRKQVSRFPILERGMGRPDGPMGLIWRGVCQGVALIGRCVSARGRHVSGGGSRGATG
jgi:hypothetical protein